MAEANDTTGLIYQNLIDAGCDIKTMEQCMSVARNGNYSAMLPILSQYRVTLLNKVRSGQRQIDCLDYLIFQIQNKAI